MQAAADQSRDKLRGFILYDTEIRSESRGVGDVALQDSSSGSEENAGIQFDTFSVEPVLRFRMTQTDCCDGNRLVVQANAQSRVESVSLYPAFNHPQRVGAACSESFGRSAARALRSFVVRGNAGGEFAQYRVDERSGRALAGALNEFNTFVDCSAPRNTAEPAELVNRKAERGKNLKIESGEWLSRCSGDL